ncbi:hypothetical protein CALVIDRAFT_530672 [Calocera viscosa TUFC12733]|uniref:DUF302 domain-containing protein n=1 Tax=Calocera viscosa (strain TUFC12733) TaxID=1330018 RepID=A0A167HKS0_CALVF|nr:hypothetical protein CALVIDRAFT_530672 [Calocera viscosa TUFC12733]
MTTKSVQPYTAQRLTLRSSISFSSAKAKFEKLTNRAGNEGAPALEVSGITPEGFERATEATLGERGFKYFASYPHSTWFKLFSPRPVPQSITYVLGNPLIARTMLTHDLRAGLCVPVRVILLQEEGGSAFVWDEPSSIIALDGCGGAEKRELREAARKLDEKLEKLLRDVLEV